jgi:hypothetical protein
VICWAGCRVCGSRREAVEGVKAQELVEAMLARGLQVDTHPAEVPFEALEQKLDFVE